MKSNGETCRFNLPADSAATVGRSDTVTISLNDESVSRHHALLQCAEDLQFYIADLGSSNGTQLNEKPIASPVILRHGDRISIGIFALRFFYDPAARNSNATSGIGKRTTRSFIPRLITVMVAAIRGFTTLALRVEPGVLSIIMGALFQQSGKALQKRGAWGQKYIGDAVMAIWLHPGLAPEAAELRNMFDGLSEVVAIAAGLQSTLHLDEPFSWVWA